MDYISVSPKSCLEKLYPGKWECKGGKYWIGEKFRVIKIVSKFIRDDTGEELDFPVIRAGRDYPVYKLLEDKLGGRWRCCGGKYWRGEHFNVLPTKEIFVREDTGEELDLQLIKPRRNHFIHKILEDKLGGKWVKAQHKDKGYTEWHSDEHTFHIYQSNKYIKEEKQSHTAYRRSDTKEVVILASGLKFYD